MSTPALRADSAGFSTLFIVGAGGHGREVAWLARECWGEALRIVHVVDRREYLLDEVNGAPVQLLGDVSTDAASRFVVAIGDGAARRRLATACEEIGLQATCILHPRTEISSRTELAAGAVVAAGCVVTTNVAIGRHVHVNVGCTISHDVRIGNFVTMSPGVHVSGYVHIGADVFIGTGATFINGSDGEPLVIGEGAVVAAGACVTRAVAPGALVAGVPAVQKR